MPEDPMVSGEWLHEHLGDERVKVVDASWHLPGDPRDPKADYLAARIPGAVFFDIDDICDRASPLPHMVPPLEQFEDQAGALGITTEDTVVVYDGVGLFSAPRVWWTFRLFGHGKVFVLDGGLPKWRAEAGRPRAGRPSRPGVHASRRGWTRTSSGASTRCARRWPPARPRCWTCAPPPASAARRQSRGRACAPATCRAR
ncbi:MAG: rhodanese-like domain-containing protein [Caulobacteraceae bacterium]